MAAEEKNKALVREFFEEAWIKGNVATVDEYMAADYVEHPRPSTLPPGAEGLKQLISAYRTAFPDLKMTLDDIFAEGEMVAFRWSVSGTHLGDWLGLPPTGNHVRATGITIFRITGGKVVESWTSIDLSPTDEERRWLTEGGGWPTSGDISSTERDTPRDLGCSNPQPHLAHPGCPSPGAGTYRAGTPSRPSDPAVAPTRSDPRA